MNADARARIESNLLHVRAQIADAANRSDRRPEDIRLIAVTKFISAQVARWLVEAGCHDLGESRPQELWDKTNALRDVSVAWHHVGHLQRNKVRRTLPLVAMIHSVDSLRLLKAIDAEAQTLDMVARVLLEVKISDDADKHGFAPEEMEEALEHSASCSAIRVEGLMGMASLHGGLTAARRDFARLRSLRDRLARNYATPLAELSMGMSGDFAEAIAEGATMVRVGSALFAGIDPTFDTDAPPSPPGGEL